MSETLTPVFRLEYFIVAAANGTPCDLEPIFNEEKYLHAIAGASVDLPMPIGRTQEYLAKLAGMDVEIPDHPIFRTEYYLAHMIDSTVECPAPIFREEMFYYEWALNEYVTIVGNPVSFTAKAAPLRQLEVAFSPVQDLHGYDSPWPAGGGKNKFDIDHPLYTAGSQSVIDNYCCKVEDGKLYNGGVAGNTPGASITIPVIAGQTYTFSFTLNGERASWEIRALTLDGVLWTSNTVLTRSLSTQTGAITTTVTIPSGYTHLYLACFSATQYGSWETNIQLELGSSATSFAPYSNLCPISGWDSLTVEQRGVNLWNKANAEDGYVDDADGEVKGGAWYKNTGFIHVIPNAQYYVKTEQTSAAWGAWYDADKQYIGGVTGYHLEPIITAPANAAYVNLTVKDQTGNVNTFGLNYPATVTEFVPYTGRSISISLGSTVYSGTVDVVTGVGEITGVNITFDGTEAWNTATAWRPTLYSLANTIKHNTDNNSKVGLVCDHFKETTPNESYAKKIGLAVDNNGYVFCVPTGESVTGAEMKAWFAENPTTVIFPLATPIPIQLTPQEVESLAGDNTMWTDGDSLTVEYRSN